MTPPNPTTPARKEGGELLVKRLRQPPFGTETSERLLFAAAADEIERLRAALEPFAKAAEVKLCGGDYWTSEKTIQGTDVAFYITFGDLRDAATALPSRPSHASEG